MSNTPVSHTENDGLRILPLVFGLLPQEALYREKYDALVKPLIEKHLQTLGINKEPILVRVLKEIADQYYRTEKESTSGQVKYSIERLKAYHPDKYSSMIKQQNNRCALCGTLFDGTVIESLDHILPWRLAGEGKLTGSNWQILCFECNRGKREFLSSLQSPLAFNWIYSKALSDYVSEPNAETRYVLLAQCGCCERCGNTSRQALLKVKKRIQNALCVVDNLEVLCEFCDTDN